MRHPHIQKTPGSPGHCGHIHRTECTAAGEIRSAPEPNSGRARLISMKKQVIRFILSAALLSALVAFIWSRSLADISQSMSESDIFTDWAMVLLGRWFSRDTVSFLVRKTAHFAEYAALGFSACALFFPCRQQLRRFFLAAVLCLAIAAADESLQLLTDRSARLADVGLDVCGALFGVGLFFLLRALLRKRCIR